MLLLAAGVVASGGGLGGLESLGQIASGPSLPDTGLAAASRPSLEDAEIVGADPPRSSGRRAPAPPAAELASAAPSSAGPPAAAAAGEPAPRPTPPVIRTEAPRPTDPGTGALVDAPNSRPAPPGAGGEPIEELQGATQGLGNSISEPLRPLGNQLLDLLELLQLQRR